MFKDLHCHLLPGIDDGSKSIEESIETLRIAEEEGVTEIILTPHYIENTRYSCNNKNKKELKLLITHYGETATKEAIVLCGDKTNKKNIHYFGLIVKHHAFSTRNKYYENILNSFKVE